MTPDDLTCRIHTVLWTSGNRCNFVARAGPGEGRESTHLGRLGRVGKWPVWGRTSRSFREESTNAFGSTCGG